MKLQGPDIDNFSWDAASELEVVAGHVGHSVMLGGYFNRMSDGTVVPNTSETSREIIVGEDGSVTINEPAPSQLGELDVI